MKNDNGHNKRHFEHAENARQGQEYGHVHQVQEREQHDHDRFDHAREHVQQAAQQAERRGDQHQQQTPHLNGNEITIFIGKQGETGTRTKLFSPAEYATPFSP